LGGARGRACASQQIHRFRRKELGARALNAGSKRKSSGYDLLAGLIEAEISISARAI
jgi:hypothetical protein